MIQKSKLNQIGNSLNPYQGDTKKVLTVCSAGLLRSATLQNLLIKKYGYNVRNCGTSTEFALIPISTALITWADEIVFVNGQNFSDIQREWNEDMIRGKVITLCIPDSFGFNDPDLIKELDEQYSLVLETESESEEKYITVIKSGPKFSDLQIKYCLPNEG